MADNQGNERGSTLLSAWAPVVERRVEETLRSLSDIVVLHRLTRAAGRRDWYLIRSLDEWREVVTQGRPGDAFSLFLRRQLALRGLVDSTFASEFVRLLKQVNWPRSEVVLGEAVVGDPQLRDTQGWALHQREEAREWLRDHWGSAAVAGLHPDLWPDREDELLTVYIPQPDGELRPGIY